MSSKLWLFSTILNLLALIALCLIHNYPPYTYIAPQAIYEQTNPIIYLAPILLPVCSCESTGRPDKTPTHYEQDGVTVLRGRLNNKDVGLCQISETYWLDISNELGYDIKTEVGNILMANYIYENNGIEMWKWSKNCWFETVQKLELQKNSFTN